MKRAHVMARRLLATGLGLSALCAFAPKAHAQQFLPMPKPAPDERGDNADDFLESEAPGSIKLFDARRSRYTWDAMFEVTQSRDTHHAHWDEHGFNFAIGRSVGAHESHFFVAGATQLMFRAIDSKSYAFSLTTNSVMAGVELGPIDIHTRVGLSLLTIDTIHAQFSAELISPLAGAGIGLHVGKLALNLEANSEYLWRWFGPSYFIRGVSLTLQIEGQRPKTTMNEEQRSLNDAPNVFNGLPGFGIGGPGL